MPTVTVVDTGVVVGVPYVGELVVPLTGVLVPALGGVAMHDELVGTGTVLE
jgi:hypothetical protein